MTISDDGVQFICSFEGFSATPYPDPGTHAKPYTIGYGTTIYPNGTVVTLQDPPVTEDQARGYIQNYVNNKAESWLNANLPSLSQNQFDALCSFIYNLGLGNLRTSSLLTAILAGADNDAITADFKKWDMSAGHMMPGLERRRVAEAALYCNGTYTSSIS